MKSKVILLITLLLCICFVLCSCNNDKSVETVADSATESKTNNYVNTLPEPPTEPIPCINNPVIEKIDPISNYTISNGYARPISYVSNVVKTDKYAYVADSTGIRQVDSLGNEKYIYDKNSVGSIAINSDTILFTSYGNTNDYSKKKYAIMSMNTDGQNIKKLVTTSANAIPIMIYDNKLYFIDYADNDDYKLGLFIADLSTDKCEAVEGLSVSYESIFTYNDSFIFTTTNENDTEWYSLVEYNYKTGETHTLIDIPIDNKLIIDNDKFYVSHTAYMNYYNNSDNENNSNICTIYQYDPESRILTEVLSENVQGLQLDCVYNNTMFYCTYSDNKPAYFMREVGSDTSIEADDQLPVTITTNGLLSCDGTIYDGSEFQPIETPDYEYEIIDYIGQIFFMKESDYYDDNIVIISKAE